jgi:hypothetical protein
MSPDFFCLENEEHSSASFAVSIRNRRMSFSVNWPENPRCEWMNELSNPSDVADFDPLISESQIGEGFRVVGVFVSRVVAKIGEDDRCASSGFVEPSLSEPDVAQAMSQRRLQESRPSTAYKKGSNNPKSVQKAAGDPCTWRSTSPTGSSGMKLLFALWGNICADSDREFEAFCRSPTFGSEYNQNQYEF